MKLVRELPEVPTWEQVRKVLNSEQVLALPLLTAKGMCKPGTLGLPKPIFEAVQSNHFDLFTQLKRI